MSLPACRPGRFALPFSDPCDDKWGHTSVGQLHGPRAPWTPGVEVRQSPVSDRSPGPRTCTTARAVPVGRACVAAGSPRPATAAGADLDLRESQRTRSTGVSDGAGEPRVCVLDAQLAVGKGEVLHHPERNDADRHAVLV